MKELNKKYAYVIDSECEELYIVTKLNKDTWEFKIYSTTSESLKCIMLNTTCFSYYDTHRDLNSFEVTDDTTFENIKEKYPEYFL